MASGSFVSASKRNAGGDALGMIMALIKFKNGLVDTNNFRLGKRMIIVTWEISSSVEPTFCHPRFS